MDPVAQGTQPGAENPNGNPEGTPASTPNDGIQKRINELVAEREQYKEMYARAMEQTSTLVASITELQTQPRPPPADAIQIDPDERQRFEALASPYLNEIRKAVGELRSVVGRQQMDAATQGTDPRVAKRAQELQANWQKQGKSGWVPEDAVTFAAGEIARADARTATAARNGQQTFNAGAPLLTGSNAAPSITPADQVPADINSWPYEKQAQFWEKRSGDKPF